MCDKIEYVVYQFSISSPKKLLNKYISIQFKPEIFKMIGILGIMNKGS